MALFFQQMFAFHNGQIEFYNNKSSSVDKEQFKSQVNSRLDGQKQMSWLWTAH